MPRRSHLVVNAANHRSMRLIHMLVGRERNSQRLVPGRLVCRDVVDDEVHVEFFGDAAVDQVQNATGQGGVPRVMVVSTDFPSRTEVTVTDSPGLFVNVIAAS